MARPSHYSRHKRYHRTCPICGSTFVATRSDARYDTPACRKTISRALRSPDASGRLQPMPGSGQTTITPKGAQQP
jgi:ribosomal protein S27AE